MLQPTVFAIRVGYCRGKLRRQQCEAGGKREQRDIPCVTRHFRMHMAVRQDQELHGELDVDHAARIVLEVE